MAGHSQRPDGVAPPLWIIGVRGDESRQGGRGLVVAEIALACSLLVGSAFLLQSFVNLAHTDRGLDAAGVMHLRLGLRRIAEVDPVRAKVAREETLRQVQTARSLVLDAVQAALSPWPSVGAVAFSQELPPVSGGGRGSVRLNDEDEWIASDGYRVGASFFSVYGIRLLRGRTFAPGDSDAEVVIGERLAGTLWAGTDPIGQTLSIGREKRRVIGIVSEIRLPTLDESLDRPEFYQPLERHADVVYLSVRCSGTCPDEAGFARVCRRCIRLSLCDRSGPGRTSISSICVCRARPPRSAGCSQEWPC